MDVDLTAGACVDSPGAWVGLLVWESELHATAANTATNMVAKAANPYLGKIRKLLRLVTDIPRAATAIWPRLYVTIYACINFKVSSTAWNASSMSAGSTQPM